VDLARQMIRLAGLREGEDIAIEFIGLRPGEKLHEELHTRDEAVRITRRERILTWDLPAEDEAVLRAQVAQLEQVAVHGDPAAIRRALLAVVPEYRPDPAREPVS
jgi:O-antigen biosynthesis protein WbqV